MRLLGIDYGTRNIGVAVTDGLGIGARGVTTLRDQKASSAVERIGALVEEFGADAIVVGLPVGGAGELGDAAHKVLRFVELLKGAVSVPVHTCGERLTSFEAEERMRELGWKADERKRRVDEMAAAIILEEFMATRADGSALDG